MRRFLSCLAFAALAVLPISGCAERAAEAPAATPAPTPAATPIATPAEHLALDVLAVDAKHIDTDAQRGDWAAAARSGAQLTADWKLLRPAVLHGNLGTHHVQSVDASILRIESAISKQSKSNTRDAAVTLETAVHEIKET